MKLEDRFRKSEDVVAREVAGEMVLLDLASGLYFGLNSVGCQVWEALDEEPRALADVCAAIEAQFNAPRDVIERDVMALMQELSEKALVNRGAP